MKYLLLAVGVVIAYFALRGHGRLPAELLPEFAQGQIRTRTMAGGACTAERCLTVVVAPWCPVCRRLDSTIIALRAAAEASGVPVSMVIGMDKPEALRSYGEHYAQPVLLDEQRNFTRRAKIRTVPYFAVTDRNGEIVAEIRGGYDSVEEMRKRLSI